MKSTNTKGHEPPPPERRLQHLTVRTRTSIVLLMNPAMGSWGLLNFITNFPRKFDPPFLSCFDYIFNKNIIVIHSPWSEEEIMKITKVTKTMVHVRLSQMQVGIQCKFKCQRVAMANQAKH